jgi:uncharacterized membrane protein HdeD (DUF308 family)
MNKPLAFLLHVVGVIGLIAALKGALQLLGTFSITDDHLRGVAQVRHGTSLVLGGIIAYFSLRSASRRWSGK